MKIVAIVGSLRKESLNLKLANIVKSKMTDIDFEIVTLESIPFFNEDIEFPSPETISSLRNKVNDADLLWIFSPEYNHSYSGVMKNTLDWLSRQDENGQRVLSRKKIALSGATYAAAGTVSAQDDLVQMLGFLNTDIMMQPRLAYGNGNLPEADDEYLNKMINAVNTFMTK